MGVNAREILTGKIATGNVNQKNNFAMENVLKVFFCVKMRKCVKMKGNIGMIAVETANPNYLHVMVYVQRDSIICVEGVYHMMQGGLSYDARGGVYHMMQGSII